MDVAALAGLVLLAVISCSSAAAEESQLEPGLYAKIITKRGDMLIRLAPELAPMTVTNFVGLAEGTMDTVPESSDPFYDGLTFHRIVPDFVIQGGDPMGDGTGGPGYQFPTETRPELLHDGPGVIAMANSGPNTNGSQFYVTLGATPHLDGGYNVFGRVIDGLDVIGRVAMGDVIERIEIIRSGPKYESYSADSRKLTAMIETKMNERAVADAAARQKSLDEVLTRFATTEALAGTDILIDPESSELTGTGEPPETGATVSVHLRIELVDGTVLDDTRQAGQPFTFTYRIQPILEGAEIVIGTLRVGDRIRAIIPPELGFGMRGSPPAVRPGSYLIFDIERLE